MPDIERVAMCGGQAADGVRLGRNVTQARRGHRAIFLDMDISPELFAIVAVGTALAVLILRATSRIDADRRAFQAEAAADRRAWQASMDDFRADMRRLAERQAHVEGRSAAD